MDLERAWFYLGCVVAVGFLCELYRAQPPQWQVVELYRYTKHKVLGTYRSYWAAEAAAFLYSLAPREGVVYDVWRKRT